MVIGDWELVLPESPIPNLQFPISNQPGFKMKMGLVGFAGSGKSTVFEWLTGEKPDPSKVQQGQTAMADVPDERLAKIAAIIKPKKTTYTKVAVLDTPGLTAGGDQKDNARRLGVIREANGMVVVLDGYTRTDFAASSSKFRDECLFADMEIVGNRISKLESTRRRRSRRRSAISRRPS